MFFFFIPWVFYLFIMHPHFAVQKRAIKNKSTSSALFEHTNTQHKNTPQNINVFKITFINKSSKTLHTTLSEAEQIQIQKPTINRKHELTTYTITKHLDNNTTFWSPLILSYFRQFSSIMNHPWTKPEQLSPCPCNLIQ